MLSGTRGPLGGCGGDSDYASCLQARFFMRGYHVDVMLTFDIACSAVDTSCGAGCAPVGELADFGPTSRLCRPRPQCSSQNHRPTGTWRKDR